jgi:hypothetical protein
MDNVVSSKSIDQKIRIERFCKRIFILLLVGLPIISTVFNLVSWLRYGVDLPYLDDIRPYYQKTAGSLNLHDLFTFSNDTLYPVGMALDSLAFRWLSGNSIAYQAVSMTLVLGGILFVLWKLLDYCLEDKLLCAAAFSSSLLMLQPASYWGLQNMAYHQVLPLLMILSASLVSVSRLGTKSKCLIGAILAATSGLTYISGAFAFLAFSMAMIIRELVLVKKSPQIIVMAISMLVPSVITSLAQGWVIVAQHGVHRADTQMAYPWDADFWLFTLAKVGRSLYLGDMFPHLSLILSSIGLVLLFLIPALCLMLSRKCGSYSALGRVSSIAVPIFSAILVYLVLVAAGRANFHPAGITSGIELFKFSFGRFHFFWVCVAWPLVIAFVFALIEKTDKVFPVTLVVVMCFGSVALFFGTKITAHDEYYKQTYDMRVANLACLNKGNEGGVAFQCPGVYPGKDMQAILRYANFMDASFAGLASVSQVAFGAPGAIYEMTADGFDLQNLQMNGSTGEMISGTDPMIILNQAKLGALSSCQLLQVRVRLEAKIDDLAQLFYIPTGESLSEANSSVKPVSVGVNDLKFQIASKKGFFGYLRFDPVMAPQNIAVRNIEVRCLYDKSSSEQTSGG